MSPRVRTLIAPTVALLKPNGQPDFAALQLVVTGGSLDGLFGVQDRLAAVSGRLANPMRLDEMTVTAAAARIWKVHVGQTVTLGFFKSSQSSTSSGGSKTLLFTQHVKVTGIVVFNSQVLQDDIDRTYGFAVISRALLQKADTADPANVAPVYFGIRLRRDNPGVPAVEQQLLRLVPRGFTTQFHVEAYVLHTVELSMKPESVALGAFGAVAALVCLILALQALSRHQRRRATERGLMRSLGARPRDTLAEALLGAWGSIGVGTAFAVLVAVGLSPLFPIGPVRPVYPDRGLSFDQTVLGFGALALIALLGGASLVMAWRGAPHRLRHRDARAVATRSIARAARNSGLPVSGTLGVHFALEPGRGRNEVPVRSVLVGAVLAVTLVVTTLTFASGFNTLITRPALYGWNWTYSLTPSNSLPPAAQHMLDRDPLVAGWSGADYTDAEVDGQVLPIMLMRPGAKVQPPILSGHSIRSSHQVVLGAATLAELHKRVGQTVSFSYGSKASYPAYIPPTTMTIVGTATFPAIGYSSYVAEHTAMGTGALLPDGVQPAYFLKAMTYSDPNLNGPNLAFVRMKPGVSPAVGRADMQRIATAADKVFAADPNGQNNDVIVLGVQRPAQIVNYRSVGSTPELLAAGLALGAIVALGLTLLASVRRRRRDLALLKTLGLSRRQVGAAIAWQASVDGVIGAVIGVPLGVALGRELWTLFARSINAVPDPAVPLWPVILVGVGSLVVANLAAALPGRSAARTVPGLVLRSE